MFFQSPGFLIGVHTIKLLTFWGRFWAAEDWGLGSWAGHGHGQPLSLLCGGFLPPKLGQDVMKNYVCIGELRGGSFSEPSRGSYLCGNRLVK